MPLRPVTDDDRDMVRRWRNHPKVRQAFIHQDLITPEGHAQWWAGLSEQPPPRILLIYSQDGHDCGVVMYQRIDWEARSSYWGYFLDNDGLDAREGTLKAWMEIQREAVQYADEVLGFEVLDSDVLEANSGVLRFNQRNGCLPVGERDVDINGRQVHVIELRRLRGGRHSG